MANEVVLRLNRQQANTLISAIDDAIEFNEINSRSATGSISSQGYSDTVSIFSLLYDDISRQVDAASSCPRCGTEAGSYDETCPTCDNRKKAGL